MDARRAEIAAAVAAARAEREVEEAKYFGEHVGISCDGCGLRAPLVGYRYHCKMCNNHDVCESCYKLWDGGKGTVSNALNQQRLSTDPSAHNFVLHKDAKGFTPLVKGAGAANKGKRFKPNDPCPCGSGNKYKKCCRV